MSGTYQCPRCESNVITVEVTQQAKVAFGLHGEHEVQDVSGDTCWNDESGACCGECGFTGVNGKLMDFIK